MKIELNEDQLEIIRMALSDAIEKFIGVSIAQANYIQNIDNGMSEIEAKKKLDIPDEDPQDTIASLYQGVKEDI